jgi:hypothetical protein
MTSDKDKVVRLHPRYIREASKLLDTMPEKDIMNIAKLFWSIFLTEVRDGLERKELGPFFEMVDKLYEEAGYGPGYAPNCYFCDHVIDGNAEEFNLDSHLCLSCTVKVANVLTAFGIDHRILFSGMAERAIQRTRIKGGKEGP